jgi:hypothetical protein
LDLANDWGPRGWRLVRDAASCVVAVCDQAAEVALLTDLS